MLSSAPFCLHTLPQMTSKGSSLYKVSRNRTKRNANLTGRTLIPALCGTQRSGGTRPGLRSVSPSTSCFKFHCGSLGISHGRTNSKSRHLASVVKLTYCAASRRLGGRRPDVKPEVSCHFLQALSGFGFCVLSKSSLAHLTHSFLSLTLQHVTPPEGIAERLLTIRCVEHTVICPRSTEQTKCPVAASYTAHPMPPASQAGASYV